MLFGGYCDAAIIALIFMRSLINITEYVELNYYRNWCLLCGDFEICYVVPKVCLVTVVRAANCLPEAEICG